MRKISVLPRVRLARSIVLATSLSLLVPLAAKADEWTLESSAARALEVSPSLADARAAVMAQRGELHEAGRWPNPSFEITVGDRLGQETGDGGWDGQEYAFSQPLPIGGRLGAQRRAASKALDAAQAATGAAALEVELITARAFHRLQWARERVELAQAQLERAREFRRIAERRAAAGDIPGREALRLEVLAAEAEAALDDARREEAAMRLRFLNLLELPDDLSFALSPLSAPGNLPPLERLEAQLAEHPALRAARESAEAASARVDVARAERIPDLELRVAREEEIFDGAREPAYSIGLQVEIPLWSTGSGYVTARRGEAIRAIQEYQLRLREHRGALVESYAQLTRLLERLARHEQQVLEPARRVLALTEKGYAAGELGLAELIDATRAEWRASQQQRDLLLEARMQEADLRFAAGERLAQAREASE